MQNKEMGGFEFYYFMDVPIFGHSVLKIRCSQCLANSRPHPAPFSPDMIQHRHNTGSVWDDTGGRI